MTTPTQLSNCCQAQVILNIADEGTCYYECSQCHKPCEVGKQTNVNHKPKVVNKIVNPTTNQFWKEFRDNYFQMETDELFDWFISKLAAVKREGAEEERQRTKDLIDTLWDIWEDEGTATDVLSDLMGRLDKNDALTPEAEERKGK